MIPERNKEIFLDCIAKGATFEEACSLSQISRPSAFRFLKDPKFKERYDTSLFEIKKKNREEEDRKNMENLKKLVLNRK